MSLRCGCGVRARSYRGPHAATHRSFRTATAQVLPSEDVELCLCAADLDEVVVTIAWFRPTDGLEYVWRFVV